MPIFSVSRYITVMFFLSNVTEGGELVFQIADNATYSKEVFTSP